MPPYKEQYAKGSRVRVRPVEALVHFRETWKFHHPLTEGMVSFAGREASVESVGFYHGGDVLYTLSGIPGTWHEACLQSATAEVASVVFELDGAKFSTLEEFFAEISRVLISGSDWGHNLDAFNDILRGGFGTPEAGFTIRWRNHTLSAARLGYSETVRQLELRLGRCHPSSRASVRVDLEQARRGAGSTVFDWLIEIIRDHGPGGSEGSDGVLLELV
jgi:RNAse (barnase) inhibitor barstar